MRKTFDEKYNTFLIKTRSIYIINGQIDILQQIYYINMIKNLVCNIL